MKKIVVMVLLGANLGFGQNFFESEEPQYEEETSQSSAFQSQAEYDEPDQGLDGPGNPGEPRVPIDHWIFLLPIAGIALGFYFLKKKKENLI